MVSLGGGRKISDMAFLWFYNEDVLKSTEFHSSVQDSFVFAAKSTNLRNPCHCHLPPQFWSILPACILQPPSCKESCGVGCLMRYFPLWATKRWVQILREAQGWLPAFSAKWNATTGPHVNLWDSQATQEMVIVPYKGMSWTCPKGIGHQCQKAVNLN